MLTIILLIGGGFLAGLIDSTAGGGGLIALPILLGMGLPPATALGTNRLQSLIGESIALRRFILSGEVDVRDIQWVLVNAALGAALGTVLVQQLDAALLKKIIPVLLLSFIAYSALSGRLFRKPLYLMPKRYFALLLGLCIGFYNGFFGPGTGALWFSAFLALQGYSIKQSAMVAKAPNIAGNLASVLCFAGQLQVAIVPACLMVVGQIFGASLGARLVVNKGAKIIKPIFLVVVALMAIELGVKAWV